MGILQPELIQQEILNLLSDGLLGIGEGQLALTPLGLSTLQEGSRPVLVKEERFYLVDRFDRNRLVVVRGGVSSRRKTDFLPAPARVPITTEMVEEQLAEDDRYQDQRVKVTDFTVLEEGTRYLDHALVTRIDPLDPGRLQVDVLDRGKKTNPEILPLLGLKGQEKKLFAHRVNPGLQDAWALMEKGWILLDSALPDLRNVVETVSEEVVLKGAPLLQPLELKRLLKTRPTIKVEVFLQHRISDEWQDLRDSYPRQVKLSEDKLASSRLVVDGQLVARGEEAFLSHQFGGEVVQLVQVLGGTAGKTE